MIDLPQVTLLAIDCVNPLRVIDAMQWSTRHVRFAAMVLLTDLKKHPNTPDAFNHGLAHLKIKLVHHEESDVKVPCPRKEHYPLPRDYELAALKEPSLNFETSHCLFFEWDAAICNPWAWEKDWLRYDYIGAPWPEFYEEGWHPCDGRTNNVGNGGFSLRSWKYCQRTREFCIEGKFPPVPISSDMDPCLDWRPKLEKMGVRFAPDYVAARFSCENLPYSGQFGAHGKWTFELNNWGDRFASIRP